VSPIRIGGTPAAVGRRDQPILGSVSTPEIAMARKMAARKRDPQEFTGQELATKSADGAKKEFLVLVLLVFFVANWFALDAHRRRSPENLCRP
jgi:hypothetical protein